jgi:ketosteroid isomerase-like protein
MGPPAASTRWLLAAGTVLATLTVVGLAVGGGEAELEPDEPAATVRDFLVAVEQRDVDGLRAAVAPDLRQACSAEELRRATRDRPDAEVRTTLVATELVGDRAEVEVRRTEHRGEPPLGRGEIERTEVFELTRDGDDWLITHVPWGYHTCPEWSR